jgi:hypothetical protein
MISNLLIITLFTFSPVRAQDDPAAVPMGFIRVVDAVNKGTGPLNVFLDGEDIRPKGYQPGDATGGMGQKPGSHRVKFVREGVVAGATTVIVRKDQTMTLIPFAKLIPASNQKPASFEVRILRLEQKSLETGRMVTFVSVSINPEVKAELMDDDGTWRSTSVKHLKSAEITMKSSQAFVSVKLDGHVTSPIPVGGNGNYVLVIYDDADSKLRSVYFRDFKYLSPD